MRLIIKFFFYLILLQAEHLQNDALSWPCDIQVPKGPEDLEDFEAAVLGMYIQYTVRTGNEMIHC